MDINLKLYDGFKFEEFCRTLLQHSYDRVDITSKTGDGGIDLIAYKNGEVYIVECKHHPNKTISRPVVQKLHSAILTSGARNGIIMTTGKLSSGAKEYINTLKSGGVTISIMELKELQHMGHKYGYNIFLDSQTRSIRNLKTVPEEYARNLLYQEIEKTIESYPSKPKEYINITTINIETVDCYKSDYKVDALYRTSVVEHPIKRRGALYFDKNKRLIKTNISNYIWTMENDRSFEDKKCEIYDGEEIELSISKQALDYIPVITSETISYRGKNNVTYTKEVVPKKKDISIDAISRVNYPKHLMDFTIVNQKQKFTGIVSTGQLLKDTELRYKSEISKASLTKIAVCDVCKSIADQTNTGESYSCNKCNRVVCFEHTYLYKPLMLLNLALCPECAQQKKSSIQLKDKYSYNKNMPKVTFMFYVSLMSVILLVIYYYFALQ